MLSGHNLSSFLSFVLWPGVLVAEVESVLVGRRLPMGATILITLAAYALLASALLRVIRYVLIAWRDERFVLETVAFSAVVAAVWYGTLTLLRIFGISGAGTLKGELGAFFASPVLFSWFRLCMFVLVGVSVIVARRSARGDRFLTLFGSLVPMAFQVFAYRRGIPWMLRDDSSDSIAIFLVAPTVLGSFAALSAIMSSRRLASSGFSDPH